MKTLRFFGLIVMGLIGVCFAIAMSPASWWASQVVSRSSNQAFLSHVTGTIANGTAIVHIPTFGVSTPIAWRVVSPIRLQLLIGSGSAALSVFEGLRVIEPVKVSIRHPQFTAALTIMAGTRMQIRSSQFIAAGSVTTPQVRVVLPQTSALFDTLQVALSEGGTLKGTAGGDAQLTLDGTLHSLAPPRGQFTLTLSPTARNPQFDAGVRNTLTSAGENRYTYAHTLR